MSRPVALALGLLLSAPALAVETVRIHIGDVRRALTLRGEGLAVGRDAPDARFTPVEGGKGRLRVRSGRLEWNGALWPEDSLRFRAGEEARDAGVPSGTPIRADGFEVRGDVVATVHRGRLRLVNVLPLEDYLAAVLGSEMPTSFPEEALKAQAVAARTYALQKKLADLDAPFHLGASVLSQVYGGVSSEDPRTRAAVAATRGEVLTWQLQPIEAYFHASCGGRTEDGQMALGRALPYLTSVDCPCDKLPASRWEATVSATALEKALKRDPQGHLEPTGHTRSGRVTRLDLGPEGGVDAVTFRARVGYSTIKSLWFEVEPVDGGSAFHFEGRGYGHGAGMCQWGAKALADLGRTYRQILRHYYPGTEIQRLY